MGAGWVATAVLKMLPLGGSVEVVTWYELLFHSLFQGDHK